MKDENGRENIWTKGKEKQNKTVKYECKRQRPPAMLHYKIHSHFKLLRERVKIEKDMSEKQSEGRFERV